VSIREAVAVAYGLSLAEVNRWSDRTVATFYRAAVNRGWLIQPCEESE
jgi:hypothetical protein